MNQTIHRYQFPLLLLVTFPLLRGKVSASTLYTVNYGADAMVTKEPDTYYNVATGIEGGTWDSISTIFHSPVNTNDSVFSLTSSLYARNYDADPSRPGATGLLDRQTLTGDANPPWLVKHGLPPAAVGNLNSDTTVNGQVYTTAASYIVFTIGLPAANTMHGEKLVFDGAALTITGFNNIDSEPQIWGATNGDGFDHSFIPTITQPFDSDTDVYTFDFSNLNYTSTTLEMRVYGVVGNDQGTFISAQSVGLISPPSIPEPTSLLIIPGLVLGLRRRRSANLFSI